MKHLVIFENFDETINTDIPILFVGGLDTGKYLSLSQQVKLINTKRKITPFRHSDYSGPRKHLSDNPNQIVILFSAGCNQANTLSQIIKNKNLLFIIEPWNISKNGGPSSANISVNKAVDNGVPEKNVIVMEPIDEKRIHQAKGRGWGIVNNPTLTPKGLSHWKALTFGVDLMESKMK
jgi:hypothetical protein